MSIIGSMYTASTALDAFGTSMAVVGHNIANLNTAGFKASRVNYADVFPTVLARLKPVMACSWSVPIANLLKALLNRLPTSQTSPSVAMGFSLCATARAGAITLALGSFTSTKTLTWSIPTAIFSKAQPGIFPWPEDKRCRRRQRRPSI